MSEVKFPWKVAITLIDIGSTWDWRAKNRNKELDDEILIQKGALLVWTGMWGGREDMKMVVDVQKLKTFF